MFVLFLMVSLNLRSTFGESSSELLSATLVIMTNHYVLPSSGSSGFGQNVLRFIRFGAILGDDPGHYYFAASHDSFYQTITFVASQGWLSHYENAPVFLFSQFQAY